MASFVCLEKQPQSALKILNMQTMCRSIFSGKTTRAYCSLWAGVVGFCSCSWSRLSQEMLPLEWSDTDWGSSPTSTQVFLTSSSQNKWRICRQNLPQRGRWFLTLASPRYEVSASILLKKVSCKIHSLRSWRRNSSFCTSHATRYPPHPKREFCLCVKVADLMGSRWCRT